MSAPIHTRLTSVRGARRSLRAAVGVILAVAGTGVTATSADAQRRELYSPGFTNWPSELASRAPALADGIERDLGERPWGIEFFARDKLFIIIRNPASGATTWFRTSCPRTSSHPSVGWVSTSPNTCGIHSRAMPASIVDQSQNGDGTPPSSPKSDSGRARSDEAARHEGFVRGPPYLAPRGWALVDSIGRAFERPRELEFTGRDTIDVTFWSPGFWLDDMQSKEFPRASLPVVRKAAEQVGGLVWRIYGRDAGINVIRVTFVRMRRVKTSLMTRDVPVQELTGVLTRQQLETGTPQLVALTLAQR